MKSENKEKFNKKLEIKQFWMRLWVLLQPVHRQIRNVLILIVVTEIVELFNPYVLKYIIDFIVNFDRERLMYLGGLILVFVFVNQISSIFGYFIGRWGVKFTGDAVNNLQKKAQSKMVYLSLSYHEKESTGNKISKINRGIDKVENLLNDAYWQVAPTIVQLLLTTITLFWVNWMFGLVFMFFSPIFVVITLKLNNKVAPLRTVIHDDWENESGRMAQSIININAVKSFVQEEREIKEYVRIADRILNNVVRMFNIIFKINILRDLVINLGQVFIIIFGVYLVWVGSITVGSLVFVITISQKALYSLYRISRLYDRIMDSSEAIDRLYELGQEESDITNPKNGIKPSNIKGVIEFNDVSFSYNKEGDKVLDNINLKINSGCLTALVGPSGGGKTTLARMIYRHYDPQSGHVLLDNKDLKEHDIYSFRKFISIVPQEVEIFDMSIRANIAYAKPDAGQKEIMAAARIANAEEFIEKLPKKYDTEVGERGIKLSGGQRQRIGIARAILANPRILIFDEATSNLDSYSEKLIQEAIGKIRKDRTMIIIAHRLSTIKKADKIVVLENGKVVEIGNHFELARTKGGLYSKLIKLQEMGDVV